jgi:hypothetical protein
MMTQVCTAFVGQQRVASGALIEVALKAKERLGQDDQMPVLIFDESTSQLIEVDFRGTAQDVRQRLLLTDSQRPQASAETEEHAETARGPGRPKLGVVSREVTLLPRHWEWLNSQPGGASVALRKLVEEARRSNQTKDIVRQTREAAYKFMSVMAGNEPGFEEASRALFAGEAPRFYEQIQAWPQDVRDHAQKLAEPSFH